mgnify:CR=1 FL=1
MKDYKRVTIRHEDGSYSFMYDYNATTPPIKTLLDRLAELEDKIENGTLVPKYLIVESCGTYCVCSVDTENLPIIGTYETEKEAQKKLEELYDEM